MPTQGFTVRVNGTEADIERVEVQGSSVSLDLEDSDFVEHGETVTVAYNPPAGAALQDELGNTVAAIPANELTVRNDVPDPNETDPPEPVSAVVIEDGSLVRVVFNEPVFFQTQPPGAVAGLGVTARESDSLTWTWMAPAVIDKLQGRATWYEWRYREGNGAWTIRRRINAPTVTVTGLTDATEYTIEIRAGNPAGPGPTASNKARTRGDIPDLYIARSDRIFRMASGYGNIWDGGVGAPSGERVMTGLGFDPAGDMYVCGETRDRIYRSPGGYGGTFDAGIDMPANSTSGSVAFDADGDMYFASFTTDRVYWKSGGYTSNIGWDGGIAGPSGIQLSGPVAIDPDGDLYVHGTNGRIYRKPGGYASASAWVSNTSIPGNGNNIGGICFDGLGDLFGNNRGARMYRMAGGYGNTWDAGQAISISGICYDSSYGPAP